MSLGSVLISAHNNIKNYLSREIGPALISVQNSIKSYHPLKKGELRAALSAFVLTSGAVILVVLTEPIVFPEANKDQDTEGEGSAPTEVVADAQGEAVALGTSNIFLRLLREFSTSQLLGQVESFSIIFLAMLFICNSRERKREAEAQAWGMIDGAQGSETSGARKIAIEYLRDSGANLTGLDADGADLRGIDLSNQDLNYASFKGALLEGAKFQGANLKSANFSKARLWEADFCKAKLRFSKFIDADLGEGNPVKFCGADLGCSDFQYANLPKANFEGCNEKPTNLNNASFKNATIRGIRLKGADILKCNFVGSIADHDELYSIVKDANGWEKAKYDSDFIEKHRSKSSERAAKNVDDDIRKDEECREKENIQRKIEYLLSVLGETSNKNINFDSLSSQIDDFLSSLNDYDNPSDSRRHKERISRLTDELAEQSSMLLKSVSKWENRLPDLTLVEEENRSDRELLLRHKEKTLKREEKIRRYEER